MGSSVACPLIDCGLSGVGNGTIISRFMEGGGGRGGGGGGAAARCRLPEFAFSFSHTTRDPWPGEVDGVHYHYISKDLMLGAVRSGTFFIEHGAAGPGGRGGPGGGGLGCAARRLRCHHPVVKTTMETLWRWQPRGNASSTAMLRGYGASRISNPGNGG